MGKVVAEEQKENASERLVNPLGGAIGGDDEQQDDEEAQGECDQVFTPASH